MSKKRKTSLRFEEIGVPSANHTLAVAEAKALLAAMSKIEDAKKEGHCGCYLCVSDDGIPKAVIQRLIDAGYDIRYSYYDTDGHWFIRASWLDGCCGRIFKQDCMSRTTEVTIQQMFANH